MDPQHVSFSQHTSQHYNRLQNHFHGMKWRVTLRVTTKCDLCKNQKLHHTLVFHCHVGELWCLSLPPNSLFHTQVVWDFLLLHYEAQAATLNMINILLLDLIQNMSLHNQMNQYP